MLHKQTLMNKQVNLDQTTSTSQTSKQICVHLVTHRRAMLRWNSDSLIKQSSLSLLVIVKSLTHSWSMWSAQCISVNVMADNIMRRKKKKNMYGAYSAWLDVNGVSSFFWSVNVTEVKPSSSCVFLRAQQACLKDCVSLSLAFNFLPLQILD